MLASTRQCVHTGRRFRDRAAEGRVQREKRRGSVGVVVLDNLGWVPFLRESLGRQARAPGTVTGMCACTTSAFWWRSELGKSSRRHSPTATPCSCCLALSEHEDGFPGACAYSPTYWSSISLTENSSPTCWVPSTAEATCSLHLMAHVCCRP